MTSLQVLTISGKWKNVDLNSKKYQKTYNFIIKVLKQCFHKGANLENTIYDKDFYDNGISTRILKTESHRHCTVLFCKQYDKETNGLRFIVYGEGYTEFLDYGIGVTLNGITKESAEKHCPDHITARFLDL